MIARLSLLGILALCVGSGVALAADIVEGKIYLTETPGEAPKYFYESITGPGEKPGTTVNHTRYFDADKKPLVEEETLYEDGKFRLLKTNQLQVNEQGTIEIKDGKVIYTFKTATKTKDDSEALTDNMMVADMIPALLAKSWDSIMAGNEVKIRYLLAEELDSIGFKFFKDKDRPFEGHAAVDITMKPSSFFIAALAPSIRITLDKGEGHHLLEMYGRLPIRRSAKDPPTSRKDWKAIDGRVVFSYKDAPATVAAPATAPVVAPAPPTEKP